MTRIDPANHQVTLSDGRTLDYGALVLATGAAPIRLDIPGATLPHVFLLRTQERQPPHHRAIRDGQRVVVLGSSFIGLEAAASLRKRGLEVHVVSPDTLPLEKVLGAELGGFVKALHESTASPFTSDGNRRRSPTRMSLSTTGAGSRRTWW